MAVLFAASAAGAAVDLTGPYLVSIGGFLGPEATRLEFTQTGTQLDVTVTFLYPTARPGGTYTGGTIDPDGGTFHIPFPDTPSPPGNPGVPPCTGNGMTGTVSPDGQTISGTFVQQFDNPPLYLGCVNVFGDFHGERGTGRCGDHIVVPPEQCDDGNSSDGDCCSSTCQLEAAGSSCAGSRPCYADTVCDGFGACVGSTFAAAGTPCEDGNACTTADACDGNGRCTGSAVTCPECETCQPPGGCVSNLACIPTGTSGMLRLDLDTRRMSITAAAPTPLDFGDPSTSTEQTLCVFGYDGTTWLHLASARTPAGGTCAGKPCWRNDRGRFVYRNADRTPEGVATVTLHGSSRRGALVKVRAGGENLPLAATVSGTLSAVRVQVQSHDAQRDACFGTQMSRIVVGSSTRLHARP